MVSLTPCPVLMTSELFCDKHAFPDQLGYVFHSLSQTSISPLAPAPAPRGFFAWLCPTGLCFWAHDEGATRWQYNIAQFKPGEKIGIFPTLLTRPDSKLRQTIDSKLEPCILLCVKAHSSLANPGRRDPRDLGWMMIEVPMLRGIGCKCSIKTWRTGKAIFIFKIFCILTLQLPPPYWGSMESMFEKHRGGGKSKEKGIQQGFAVQGHGCGDHLVSFRGVWY